MSRWISSRANQIEERYNMNHGEHGHFSEGEGAPDTTKTIPTTMKEVQAAHPDFKVAKTEHGFAAIHKGTGLEVVGKTPRILHENMLGLLKDLALEAVAKLVVDNIGG